MSRVRVIGAAAVLAAAPLAFLPGGLFPFQLPKIAVVFLGVALAASVPAAGRLPRALAWLTAATLAWLALSALIDGASVAEFLGLYPRYEGALALGAAAGAFWAGARLLGGPAPEERASGRTASGGTASGRTVLARLVFARTTAAGTVVVACLSVVEATGARPLAGAAGERVGSLLGNATDQGVYAAVAGLVLIPFAVTAWQRGSTPDATLFTLAEVAAVAAVALSGSRAALLGLATGGTAVLAAAWWLQRRAAPGPAGNARAGNAPAGQTRGAQTRGAQTRDAKTRDAKTRDAKPRGAQPRGAKPRGGQSRAGGTRPGLILATTGALVMAAGLGALLIPATASRLTGADAAAQASAGGRLLIWERTVGVAWDHLFTGVGPSGFATAILGRTDLEWARRVGFERPLDSPHNWALQVLVAGGLPLLALAVGWLVAAGRAATGPLLRTTALTDATWQRVHAVAGVTAAGVALLTHVSSPSLVALTAVIAGGLVARDATSGSPDRTTEATDGAAAQASPVVTRAVTSAVTSAATWCWTAAAVAGLLVALTGAVAEVPLRAARDAALSGDADGASRSCDQAHRWRPWDPAVLSVCAQNATLGAETLAQSAQQAGPEENPAADPGADDATSAAEALAATAIRFADRALVSDPRELGAQFARAVARERLGDLERALADLDTVHRSTPDDPSVLLRRGVLRARLGDRLGAVDDLQHVLRIDPSNETATHNLEIIRQPN